MKKRDVPKPKYSVGDVVTYWRRVELGGLKRAVGTVETISIKISPTGSSVRYEFEDREDGEDYDEGDINRRVMAG